MKKVFLDTNVALDYLLFRKDFFGDAEKIIALGSNKVCKLCMSSLSFSNIAYVARKEMPLDKLYLMLVDFVGFIDVASVGKKEVARTLNLKAKVFEDALQYFSAKAVKADCIVTRNTKDFPFSDIPVLTPHEFLGLQL